jgi:hypothetical protein
MPVCFMVMPFQKIRKGGPRAFHLNTTIPDFGSAALSAILADLKRLL